MKTETTVTSREAAELLAYGRDAAQSERLTGIIRNWVRLGILAPIGRDARGKSKAAFRFDRSIAAVACVLMFLRDRAGVTDHRHLAGLATMLSTPRPGADMTLIDAILSEIERDGDEPPVLLLTRWGNPAGESATSYAVVLAGEYQHEIAGPGEDWTPLMDATLSLALLLAPFLERVVIPFREREAS